MAHAIVWHTLTAIQTNQECGKIVDADSAEQDFFNTHNTSHITHITFLILTSNGATSFLEWIYPKYSKS